MRIQNPYLRHLWYLVDAALKLSYLGGMVALVIGVTGNPLPRFGLQQQESSTVYFLLLLWAVIGTMLFLYVKIATATDSAAFDAWVRRGTVAFARDFIPTRRRPTLQHVMGRVQESVRDSLALQQSEVFMTALSEDGAIEEIAEQVLDLPDRYSVIDQCIFDYLDVWCQTNHITAFACSDIPGRSTSHEFDRFAETRGASAYNAVSVHGVRGLLVVPRQDDVSTTYDRIAFNLTVEAGFYSDASEQADIEATEARFKHAVEIAARRGFQAPGAELLDRDAIKRWAITEYLGDSSQVLSTAPAYVVLQDQQS